MKLERALEHLHTAQARIEKFLEHDPGTPVFEENQAKGEVAVWYRAFAQPDPEIVPPVTDCIHNLRQALDHLAYRLAVFVGGDPPPNEDTTGFPIYDSPLTDDRLRTKIGDPKKIPATMRTALEAAQPHAGGDTELLSILHDLDNLDKHRFPPLVTVGGVVGNYRADELHAEWVDGPRLGPITDGAEIMRWQLKPGVHPVDLQFRCTNHVAFGEPSSVEGLEPHVLLGKIRTYIQRAIVPSFAPFLWAPVPQGRAVRR